MDLLDLVGTISLDTSGFESALDDVASGADDAVSSLDQIGDAADEAGSDLDDLGSDADGAGSDLDDLGSSADDAGSDLDSMGGDASDAGSELDDLASSADDAADSLDALGDSAGNAIDSVGDLGFSLGSTVTSGSDDASGAISGLSSIVSGFSGGVVAGCINAVGVIGKGVYDMATETKDASVIIAQGTGATGDALDELSQTARDALGDVKLSSQTNLADVSTNLAEINTRFGYTGDQLKDTTVLMTDFANVTGQDGASAVDLIADTMSKWQLSAEDMPGLLDDITTASQMSGESAADLESALSNNSAAFQQLGMDVDDSLSFLMAYCQAGGDSSDATAILKAAVNNLNGEVDDVPGTFQAAIQAIADADDASSALNAEVGDTGLTVADVFGTKSANKMIAAVQSEQFSIEDMSAALEDNQGAMNNTVDASTTFRDKVQNAFNMTKETIRGEASAIKSVLHGDFQGALEEIQNTPIATKMSEVFSNVQSKIGDAVSNIKSKLGIFNSDLDGSGSKGESTGTKLSNAFNNAKSNISTAISNIKSKFTELNSGMDSSASKATSTGQGLASGVQSGFNGKWSSIASNITSKVTNLISNLNSKLKIGSPSKVTEEMFGFVAEGAGIGFENEFKYVSDDITGDVEDMVTNMNAELGGVEVGAIEAGSTTVTANTSGAFDVMSTKFQQVLDLLNEYLPDMVDQEIRLDSGELVGATAKKMNTALGKISRQEVRYA